MKAEGTRDEYDEQALALYRTLEHPYVNDQQWAVIVRNHQEDFAPITTKIAAALRQTAQAARREAIQAAALEAWKIHGQLVDGLEWLPEYTEDPHDVQERVNSAILALLDQEPQP